MSTEESDTGKDFVSMLLNPSSTAANWYASIGIFGLFLGILNILGHIHPTYHVSWGGLLTFEAWNAAFEPKSEDGIQVVLSDAIHSPNEHFGLSNFYNGIETIANFYKLYSQ